MGGESDRQIGMMPHFLFTVHIYFFPPFSMEHIPSRQDILAAAKRVSSRIRPTPVLQSDALDREAHAQLFWKAECLMPEVGCFKIRGALNALLQFTEQECARGVLTQSSGNHAQAIAAVSQKMGITATIVMPKSANPIKKRNVREFGAHIVECEPGDRARNEMMERVRQETGAVVVHPFNDYRIIAGQATAAKELVEQVPDLDYIVAPVGGGGLLSGTLLAAEYFSPHSKVVAGEPMGADDAYRSLKAGSIQGNEKVDTIADGLITKLGDKTFGIMNERMAPEDIIRVEDHEIAAAMRHLWERLRVTVEPSGAVPFAAVLRQKERFYRKKIGVILSGGNVDLDHIAFLMKS